MSHWYTFFKYRSCFVLMLAVITLSTVSMAQSEQTPLERTLGIAERLVQTHTNNPQATQPTQSTQSTQVTQASQESQPVAEEGSAEASSQSNGTPLNEQLKVLELDEEGFNFQKDWWKYMVMLVGTCLALFLLVRVTRLIVRLVLCIACLVVAFFGAVAFGPLLGEFLGPRLPEAALQFLSASNYGYALAFLLCYAIALGIAGLLFRPLKNCKSEVKK